MTLHWWKYRIVSECFELILLQYKWNLHFSRVQINIQFNASIDCTFPNNSANGLSCLRLPLHGSWRLLSIWAQSTKAWTGTESGLKLRSHGLDVVCQARAWSPWPLTRERSNLGLWSQSSTDLSETRPDQLQLQWRLERETELCSLPYNRHSQLQQKRQPWDGCREYQLRVEVSWCLQYWCCLPCHFV